MDRLNKIIKIIIDEYSRTCGEREYCEGCKYYNGDCNLDNLIEMLFKWDKEIKKEQSIQLKNIDLGNVTVGEQRNKVIEDRKEFTSTVYDYFFSYDYDEKTGKHAIESFWNMVQSGIGLLQKIGINADEVMEYYNKHLGGIK